MENGEFSKAEACFLRTRVLAPESLETILNLGYALDMQGRNDEALDCYESVLALSPQNAKARYNRAAHLLRAGDFASGFADYEARFSAMKSADSRSYSQPRWDGSPLKGRSILVYCEQGLGDAIQFARYIPLLAEKGGRVMLEAQQPLISLMTTLAGVEKVVLKSDMPPQTDFHIPLMSLPHLFGTTLTSIPAKVPYLFPPPDQVEFWRTLLGERHDVFRIGLVWAGKPAPDPNRSCPPDFLAPLFSIRGARFYSLQFGECGQLSLPKEMAAHLIDLSDELGDFAKTAALIDNLDLVITIDTALAHLAGALGKTVWVMLPFAAEWRWMSDRADSPWYPNMRLFRQPKKGDWASVVSDIVRMISIDFPETNQAEADSNCLEIRFNGALSALELNDPDTAIHELEGLLLLLPDDPSVRFNLGRAYDMAGRYADAEQAYRHALSDNTGSPAIWFALGENLLKQKAYSESAFCLRKAHILKPESVEILLSLGAALSALHKLVDAIDCCRKILTIKADCTEVLYNMASLQLRRGDYLSGFANFEARLAIEKFNIDPRRYQQPRWDGSPLNGKSILIFGEQGMGDVIQFARYIPLVAEKGGKVLLEVDPPLISLFESFPGIDRIVPKSPLPPLSDVYIQILSLPYIFGTTIETVPNSIPYIMPDAAKAARWKQRLGYSPALRIGLVWRGNPNNPRDSERSCSLKTFAPLGGLPKVNFYSLQLGAAAAETAAPPANLPLTDFSDLLTDLTETAALIANLDLLISVDTAVAHLAGAMGQQVWVVLPEGSEWRWLEGRVDTPWYPTMRVFEHEQDNDWEGVLQRVRLALEGLLAEKAYCSGYKDIEASYEHGVKLKDAGDLEGAERCFRHIVGQYPDLPDPQYSLGVVLQLQRRYQESIRHYRIAITLDPGFVKAHYNLANALLNCGLYQEAINSVQAVLQLDPTHADAHWLLGMLLLRSGDFLNGWREYEWRWKAVEFTSRIPDLGHPQWDGSLLEGRTLLIHMEQGRGDMIQFIRYAPLIAASGGRVVVCALPELVSLLATVTGISQVVDRNGPLPHFDVHAPVQSLPYLLGTTLESIPRNIPYLSPDPIKVTEWQRKLAGEERFRIGLVWQGTPTHRDDHNRSCSLNEFLVLNHLAETDFYSLQIGAGAEQLHELSDLMTVIDATGQIQDFSDTAAFIANLDLIVSVDTATAHLAGAMGKPVWTLLPYVPEWRWMLERSDTPWYPTMLLFRQNTPGDWSSVFCQLRYELELLFGSPEKLNQLGINLLKSGSAVRAELAFSRAIACEPSNAESHCNRGVALDSLCRYEESICCHQEALYYKPDFFNAMFNLGNAYVAINKLEEACACFTRVIEFNQNIAAAHLCLGEVEKKMCNFSLARAAFERAIAIDPVCAEAFQGVAEVCQAEEQFEDAIVAYSRALAIKPGNVAAINMMGTAYQSIEQLGKAEECYRLALTLTPDKLTVLNNLAVVLNAQGRLKEAVMVYRQLLEIDSGYADGHWNLSVALLALGEYSEGWKEFEWRFKKSNPVPSRLFSQPLWDGSDLTGRTILLHAEQGFGDTIQFVRYAPLVAQLGGNIVIECQVHALKRLLLSLDGVTMVSVAGEPLPHFDCHLPLMSLPLIFGTTMETIPAHVPYLSAQPTDIDEWKERLESRGAFRVGLVWFGRQSQVLNRKRSCLLSTFAQLASVPNVVFYSLQIGDGGEQLRECDSGFPVIDLTEHVHDFADTAAFISNLDLVVSIDTAVAHLAGALGICTWTLLPYSSDWRWLCERLDSPWYPSMRLFRQPSQGDWASVLDNAADALHARVNGPYAERIAAPVHLTLKVGLAWAGRQDNPLNCKRSCPFSVFEQLFDLDGITFVNLQMNIAEDFDVKMVDMTDQIQDFEDTAALMANLDLIISIDTSVAHLAAATGRPTWVLLPHVADWRWAPGHKTSPWYPKVELFRQPDFGDWDGVLREVASRLSELPGVLTRKRQITPTDLKFRTSAERCELEQLLVIKRHEAQCDKTSPDSCLNLGAALALLGRDAEAVAVFKHVLELDSGHVAGHLNLAYSLLAIGKYSEAWEHFEWRLRRLPPNLLPPWPMLHKNALGSHPAETSILVHCEQGYGDTIQFSRFLPLLADAGYRVIVSCQAPIASLVATISGIDRVIPHGDPLPSCDLQILLLSLPGLFSANQESLPAKVPYLVPEKQKVECWKTRLKQKI